MRIEYIIYTVQVILVIFLLYRYIPKNKIRDAHVAYLFKLMITWSVGLIVAENRLIEYPIRMFPYANKASFIFEFFLYPAICAIFIVNYPEKKNLFGKFMYYFYYCTALTIIEVLEERYTLILDYIHWNWFLTWISFFATFLIARNYNKWFFSKIKNVNGDS